MVNGYPEGAESGATALEGDLSQDVSRRIVIGGMAMLAHRAVACLCQILYYGVARHLPQSSTFSALGRLSKRIRALFCKQFFHSMGSNVNVEHGAYFGTGRHIEIGDNSGIGVDCHIPAAIHIGNDVMMGPSVLILGRNHRFDDVNLPMRLQGYNEASAVVIEDDVWLGARVIVLPGIRIGRGSVVGAGAVVSKDVPPFAVCVGNPAHIIRYRTDVGEGS